jgi:DNA repair ATPase RecN
VIDGAERRKELARMASGDLATDEAEIFADALLRDGIKRRQSNDDSSK